MSLLQGLPSFIQSKMNSMAYNPWNIYPLELEPHLQHRIFPTEQYRICSICVRAALHPKTTKLTKPTLWIQLCQQKLCPAPIVQGGSVITWTEKNSRQILFRVDKT